MLLNYKEFGNGQPLIILHGLLGSLDNWQSIARELGRNYKVYTVDLRNHGKSPHSDTMNYEAMASDVLALMDKLGLLHAHIIGHSMGGKVAMYFALHYPERVDKLVVVDIAPKAYSRGHDQIFKALFSIDPAMIDSRSEADEQIQVYIPEPAVRLFLLKNLARDADGHFYWKMNLEVIYKNYEAIIEAIASPWPYPKPVLFLRGGKSAYIRAEDELSITDLFAQATIQTIPNAGHWLHAEAPQLFIARVTDFLSE